MMAATSKAEREHRVALIGTNASQLKTLRRILRAVVSGTCELAESFDGLTSDPYDLLIVNDFDALSPETREQVIAQCSPLDPSRRARLLVISGGGSKSELATLFSRRALTNLLAKNTEVNAAELIVTVQKILRREVFGLEKYFSWGIRSRCVRLRSSDERGPLIKEVADYAQQLGVNSRLASQFCTVADELITNAFYNAPRDPTGKAPYAHLPRTQPVVLEPAQEIEVRYCCDGNRLGISTNDPFGSLTEERLLDYLGKCLRMGDDQVDTKAGGAGLGLYYIFEAVSHLVVNIAPRKRTEIIGLIDVHGSYRNFADANKSFNVFLD